MKKTAKREHAFEGYASTYNVEILNSFNPELNLKDTESAIKITLINLLTQLKVLKFVTTLGFVFKKIESKNKTKYANFYSSSKPEIITHARDIDDVFDSIYTIIINLYYNYKKHAKIFRKRFSLDYSLSQ